MAEPVREKVKVKNSNIQEIFNKMNYGQILENNNLSKAWLKNIYGHIDKKEKSSKGKTTEIKDVTNGKLLTTVYSPKPEDVESIILTSAKNTLWSLVEASTKAILLQNLAREIERNSALFCQLEASTRGILSMDTKTKALPLLTEYLQYYASWAVKHMKENDKWQPEGITVSIISDHSFLAVFGVVLGPALAAGRNVILQTEPKISLAASLIIELAESVGIPDGVIKLLPGTVDLDPIFKHKDVEVISSFGSLHANKYNNIELPLCKKFLAVTNGKIPMIVFNNGDLDSACESIVDAVWGYQGLLPWSVNTLLVQEDIFETFVDKLKYHLSKVKMGSAIDKLADISYPIAADAKKQLNLAVSQAKLQGIEVFQSNQKSDTFQPTLLIGGRLFCNNVIVEESILPILTVLAFRTSNEAVTLANNSRYGFGASVWTENIGLANEITGKLNVANVWINCHGNFSASTPISPQKQSGTGYFGGADGFYEYVYTDTLSPDLTNKCIETPDFSRKIVSKPLQSFYGGSFKKSESGIIHGVYDHPVGKDLHNAIAAAYKGHEAWKKMTTSARNQLLWKVADEINHKKEYLSAKVSTTFLNDWTESIYEAAAHIDNLGNVSIQKSYELKSYREPVGVIAVEDFESITLIVGALVAGNSVIVLCNERSYSKFAMELCKILLSCNIPAGVFNVILNCNEDVLNAMILHKELNVYIATCFNPLLNKIKVCDLKRIYFDPEKWENIIVHITKIKNVWSGIGDSVL